ncbi:MAG: hypothetical protein ACPG5B_07225 [Chitinophagales bacterium]
MKNLFGTLALVGLICTHVVFAQNGDKIFKTATAKQHTATMENVLTSEQIAADNTLLLSKQLTLNANQTKTIAAINLETAEKAMHLRSTLRATNMSAFKTQLTALYTERDANIRSILTQNQTASYNTAKANMKALRSNAE